jgi:hypothetical protein
MSKLTRRLDCCINMRFWRVTAWSVIHIVLSNVWLLGSPGSIANARTCFLTLDKRVHFVGYQLNTGQLLKTEGYE